MVVSLIESQRTLGLIRDMILALLQEMVADYDEKWGGGKMSAAAYDVAWVAMVRNPHNPQQLAFPDSFNWLLRHQSRDGSWGYPPQTIVPTLTGLLALLKAPQQTASTCNAAKRAEAYLRTALKQWFVTAYESVAFEILVPKILAELENLGVVFEFPSKDELLKINHQKLSITPLETIYSGDSALMYSLEAFTPSIDFQRLKLLQSANGNYGNSPAATAAVLIHSPEWDKAAFEFLTHLSKQACKTGDPGRMPDAYPIDVFESSWVLYNLVLGGVDFTEEAFLTVGKKLLVWLQESLTQKGASFSRLRGMPSDSDDTGMVLAVYNSLADKVGIKIASVDCLQHFERDSYFACYELERGISLSANAHVLAALLSVPTLPNWAKKNNSINKIVDYLYSTRNSAGYWEDKWHQSPFYATATATLTLAQHPSPSVRNQLQTTVEWILATQSVQDGGWSMNGSEHSTLEETAYAVQILTTVRQKLIEEMLPKTQASLSQAIGKGVNYLWQHLDELSFPTEIGSDLKLPCLWRDKELYLPSRIVSSAVLAVLYQSFTNKQAVPR
jgi:halimadienyl-diphosphate synthase